MEQLQQQLNSLQQQFEQLQTSASIPRSVETAFRTRLGEGLIGISGRGTMSSGKLDVYNSQITTSSIGVALTYNDSGTGRYNLAGGANTGYYRFFEGSNLATWQIDYIIIFKQ